MNDQVRLARYLVHCAFKAALSDRNRDDVVMVTMGIARAVALELLEERGMSRKHALQFLNAHARLLEHMTDEMAKEAGFV